MSKYRSKYISLAVSKRRLDRLEDVGDIGLECREWFVVELDAPWARFLQVSDQPPHTGNVELGLYMRDDLENVSTVTHVTVCIVDNTLCQDGRLADEWDTNTRAETTVGHVINSFNLLDYKVFHLVRVNDDLCASDKTLDDRGQNGILDLAPGRLRIRFGFCSPGSANFMEQS